MIVIAQKKINWTFLDVGVYKTRYLYILTFNWTNFLYIYQMIATLPLYILVCFKNLYYIYNYTM